MGFFGPFRRAAGVVLLLGQFRKYVYSSEEHIQVNKIE